MRSHKIMRNELKLMKNELKGILTSFYLSKNQELIVYSQNKLTSDQFEKFIRFIKNRKGIKKLFFDGLPFDDSSLKTLVDALMEDDRFTLLSIKNPKNLSQSGAGTTSLITLLAQSTALNSLTLINCQLGVQAFALADALAKNKSLNKLAVSLDTIGTDGATAILNAANIHQSLHTLSFSNVGLDSDLDAFGIALAANHSLTKLNLANNEQINNQDAIHLATHLKKNKTLKRLMLYGANIDDQGVTALQKVFKKNHWMDAIGLDAKVLTRTSEERALQIERESPAVNLHGEVLMLSSLSLILPLLEDIEYEYYLDDFKEAPEDYRLSYVDCFKLLRLIGPNIKHPLLTNFFNSPCFFENFFSLYNLSLINKHNFRAFFSLTESQHIILYNLLHHDDSDAMDEITDDERKCLEIMLPLSQPLLYSLYSMLIDKILFSKQVFLSFASLSITNVERLHEIIDGLLNNNMLTDDSFRISMAKVMTKKTPPVESNVKKISRKENPSETQSKIMINQSLSLLMEHKASKSYPHGTFGKVKQAYAPDGTVYSVKKLSNRDNEDYAKERAKSNIHANHLLGRENAFFFKRNGFYSVVSIWQSGTCLAYLKEKALMNELTLNRFLCIMDGLSQIEKLHSTFHIHGDIKPLNIIINFAQKTMKLVDLDGVRKKGSHRRGTPRTKDYMDFNMFVNKQQSFPDDVYAMGLTIEYLFPDIFASNYKKDTAAWSMIDYAIVALVCAMRRIERSDRCTIQNALQFCRQIEASINKLSTDCVNRIARQTIKNDELSVEDVVRGRTRL